MTMRHLGRARSDDSPRKVKDWEGEPARELARTNDSPLGVLLRVQPPPSSGHGLARNPFELQHTAVGHLKGAEEVLIEPHGSAEHRLDDTIVSHDKGWALRRIRIQPVRQHLAPHVPCPIPQLHHRGVAAGEHEVGRPVAPPQRVFRGKLLLDVRLEHPLPLVQIDLAQIVHDNLLWQRPLPPSHTLDLLQCLHRANQRRHVDPAEVVLAQELPRLAGLHRPVIREHRHVGAALDPALGIEVGLPMPQQQEPLRGSSLLRALRLPRLPLPLRGRVGAQR
mmetsp:Transcript_50676/g.123542  ORF Transcript_50676/g.123542 Transcript_50676/m.123542 type:complete len:279 (-) Transcript_50676:79-915(-)